MEAVWLNDLEERVRAAAAELRRLRDENLELSEKVQTLEAQLAAGAEDEGSQAWQEEKEEIRRRVENLVGDLEKLLEED